MIFYLIGADYKTATFETRESLYIQRKAIAAFWSDTLPRQAAVLITCNRIEIFALAGGVTEAKERLAQFFKRFPQFLGNSFVIFGYQAVCMHALRLATGLESQLQGELQIAGQLDDWYRQEGFPPALKSLIQSALSRGRQIRSRTGLDVSSNNIATIVYKDIQKRLGDNLQYNAVILGTGKIAELFSRFHPENARLIFAAHRNFSKAQLLAIQVEGQALRLEKISEIIETADVLISATASPHLVLNFHELAALVRQCTKLLYVYDLALPRDIDSRCEGLPGVCLQNLETLRSTFETENKRIKDKINLARYLCEEYAAGYRKMAHVQ